jgi:hypothetical protein
MTNQTTTETILCSLTPAELEKVTGGELLYTPPGWPNLVIWDCDAD